MLNEAPHDENFRWNSLTDEERAGILLAYEESEDESNLIPLSQIILKYS